MEVDGDSFMELCQSNFLLIHKNIKNWAWKEVTIDRMTINDFQILPDLDGAHEFELD